jgi:hypothetical protein
MHLSSAKEIIFQLPISPIGTNTPLMKINGNFIKLDNIIMFDGLSVGELRSTDPKTKSKRLPERVIKRPNKREAIISPKMIAHKAIGAETNLSKVLILVSHGAITGPIDETVTKSTIPSKLGIRKLGENFLPRTKAKNKKEGINRPEITTGPFK